MPATHPRRPARRAAAGAQKRPTHDLGGVLRDLSVEDFLRDYWQKKPLLIRQAIPGFGDALDRAGLIALSARDDVESRFVAHDGTTWQLGRGPFSAAQQKRWRGRWTVLVQGVNLVLPAGDELLRRFRFIPHARLDDLMVSYATDGGGVGPHIDNYDVFLLQGSGRRRWRIGKQRDQRLVDGAPLKILRAFKPTHDWVLEPGDMLYLPPDWAHDGTAVGECMTWSIGFRTSPTQELAEQFLGFLQDRLAESGALTGRYADPDLERQAHPAEISPAMITKVRTLLEAVRWNEALVRDFLGCQLSEPKPHVFFDPPEKELTPAQLLKQARRDGLRLDARSRFLFAGGQFYLNGEQCAPPRSTHRWLKVLADDRRLSASAFATLDADAELLPLLCDWHGAGFLQFGA